MLLQGRKILITGGGSGIGLELAARLAGANDVVIAGRDAGKLERARAQVPGLRTLRLDVTSEDDARSGIAWMSSEFGGLDLLVNSAGVMRGGGLGAPDAAVSGAEEIEVNLGGSVRLTRLALPLLEASPQAAVVFVSSAVALAAAPGLAVYAATKAAVHSLARSLRAEIRAVGVQVVEVLPPLVDTGLARDLDTAKIPPSAVVDAILAGLARDREEIRRAGQTTGRGGSVLARPRRPAPRPRLVRPGTEESSSPSVVDQLHR